MRPRNPEQRRQLATERFWQSISPEPNSGCWLWTGVTSNGYGVISVGVQSWRAHRFSLALHKGNEPAGMVLHSCDVPVCVNPAHLREGTAADNYRDMVERGRRTEAQARILGRGFNRR